MLIWQYVSMENHFPTLERLHHFYAKSCNLHQINMCNCVLSGRPVSTKYSYKI